MSSAERKSSGPLIAIALALSLLAFFVGGEEEGFVEENYNRSLVLMERGQFDEAKLLLEEVLKESGEHLEALREHARMLVMTSRGEGDLQLLQAISQVDRVLILEPRDWRAFEVLGDAHLAQANPVSAVAAYVEAAFHGERIEEMGNKYREAVAMARERFGAEVELAEFR